MLYGKLEGRGVWERMDTCIYVAESLCFSLETITTLLIGYTPTQKILKKGREEKEVSFRDFPHGPMIKTSPSNAGDMGLIPDRGAKIPHVLGPKYQTIK